MKKKLLASLLSLCMLGSMLPMPALAVDESTDATLSALSYKVGTGNAVAVPNFAATTESYDVELPAETEATAEITLEGTVNDTDKATITTNDGVTLADGAGTATITVTAEDTSITKT